MSRFQRALRAWHGSPHDFDEFQDHAIGSGEGAQVYGHGHYVAEARPVAEEYRDVLTKRRKKGIPWEYKGVVLDDVRDLEDWQLEDVIEELLHSNLRHSRQGLKKLIQRYENKVEDNERILANNSRLKKLGLEERPVNEAIINYDADILSWLKENQHHFTFNSKNAAPGRLYEVHVGLDDDQLLDWDSTLKHHPGFSEKLKPIIDQILSGTDSEGYNPYTRGYGNYGQIPDQSGGDFYKLLTDMHGSPRKATQALLDAGIRGIRYRDQQSRTQSTNLYLDNEKIEPFDGTKEHHLHRRELDPDWDVASNIAFGLKADGGNNTDLDKLIAHYKDVGDRQVRLGISNTPFSHKAMNWLEQNRHRVQLKRDRGTYNYVVFDPKDIKIVRKYGRKNQLLHDFGEGAVHLTNVEGDNQHG